MPQAMLFFHDRVIGPAQGGTSLHRPPSVFRFVPGAMPSWADLHALFPCPPQIAHLLQTILLHRSVAAACKPHLGTRSLEGLQLQVNLHVRAGGESTGAVSPGGQSVALLAGAT